MLVIAKVSHIGTSSASAVMWQARWLCHVVVGFGSVFVTVSVRILSQHWFTVLLF